MDQKTLIIQTKMEHDNDFLFRCVLAIYEKQEEDEQEMKATAHANGVGFNKADSRFLSEFMELVQQQDWDAISESLDEARKRMAKYAGQLSRILQNID